MDIIRLKRQGMLMLLVLALLVSTAAAAITSSQLVLSDESLTNMSYDNSTESYADASLTNPNVYVRLCADDSADLLNKYVRYEYRVGTSYKDITVLAPQMTDVDASNCTIVDADLARGKALYPGLVTVAISDDQSFTSPTYVEINQSDGWLVGDYAINIVAAGPNLNISLTAVNDSAGNPINSTKEFIVIGVLNSTDNITDTDITHSTGSVLLTDPGFPRSYSVNGMIFNGDQAPPYLDDLNPVDGNTAVALDTNFSFDIIDDVGVDSSSINISLYVVSGNYTSSVMDVTDNATITVNGAANISVHFDNAFLDTSYRKWYYFVVNFSDVVANDVSENIDFRIRGVPPKPPSGGGGGGGKCGSDWLCGDWSKCLNGVRMRTCFDKNNCFKEWEKPPTITPCDCHTEWSCTDWGDCIDDEQERFCSAVSICYEKPYWKPRESKSCEEVSENPYVEIVEIEHSGDVVYQKGLTAKEVVIPQGDDTVLKMKVIAKGGDAVHDVVTTVDMPDYMAVKRIYPEEIQFMEPGSEQKITVVVSRMPFAVDSIDVKLRVSSDESRDSAPLKIRQVGAAVIELPSPGFNWAWLLALLLVPAIIFVSRYENIYVDEFAARELARYGVLGNRSVHVMARIAERYPGIKKLHKIKLKDIHTSHSKTLRERHTVTQELSELIAVAGHRRATIVTPLIVDGAIRKEFSNLNFIDPLRLKDIRKIREAEELDKKPSLTQELKEKVAHIDSGIDEAEKEYEELEKEVESKIPEGHEEGIIKGDESVKLDKIVNPIDVKLRSIREKIESMDDDKSDTGLPETQEDNDAKIAEIERKLKEARKKK